MAARLASRAAAAAGPSPTEASRDDDRSADAVRRRLDVFRSSTADVIRRYEAEGLLCKVTAPAPVRTRATGGRGRAGVPRRGRGRRGVPGH